MADQTQQKSSQEEDERQQYRSSDTEVQQRPQAEFDSTFLSQVAPSIGSPIDWASEYFKQADDVLRSARRVTEAQTMHAYRQQIVADVTRQVLSQIQRNPSLLGGSRTSSGR